MVTKFGQFLVLQVPLYILAQFIGSILASATLCGIFTVHKENFFGTVPTGSNFQSLVIEIIISFLLMFVICGVATDNRAVSSIYIAFKISHPMSLYSYLVKFETISFLVDWRIGRNCCWNDNTSKRPCCWVISQKIVDYSSTIVPLSLFISYKFIFIDLFYLKIQFYKNTAIT